MSWLLIQIATQVFPFFEIPNATVRFVVVALVVGFPIAMLVAWLYEQGGFVTMLQTFGALCLLVIVAALILPQEIKVPAVQTAP